MATHNDKSLSSNYICVHPKISSRKLIRQHEYLCYNTAHYLDLEHFINILIVRIFFNRIQLLRDLKNKY